MARDRQRAKQRKARRAASEGKQRESPEQRGADERDPVDPGRRPIHRANVPGPVEHTGDVDEFEAALVAGSGDDPAEPDPADTAPVEPPVADPDAPPPAAGDPLTTRSDRIAGQEPTEGAAATTVAVPAVEAKRGIGRFPGFLRASWGELQRVQWPDRRQVGQATAVVLGFVLIAGAFLGLADFLAEQLVDLIL